MKQLPVDNAGVGGSQVDALHRNDHSTRAARAGITAAGPSKTERGIAGSTVMPNRPREPTTPAHGRPLPRMSESASAGITE